MMLDLVEDRTPIISTGRTSSSSGRTDEEYERIEKSLIFEFLQNRHMMDAHSMRADGNCLFHAIAFHSMDNLCHSDVRKLICEEVAATPHVYQSFGHSIDKWVSEMKENSVWGDGLAVKAACNALLRPILVERKLSTQPPSVFIPDEIGFEQRPLITLELDETRRRALLAALHSKRLHQGESARSRGQDRSLCRLKHSAETQEGSGVGHRWPQSTYNDHGILATSCRHMSSDFARISFATCLRGERRG